MNVDRPDGVLDSRRPYVPREREFVPIVHANGCDFYYELHGQGPDIVFIHGEIHGLEYWEHQIPDFARDHRCLAYNRRAHARTELTNYGFSLVNQTRDLANVSLCLSFSPDQEMLDTAPALPATLRTAREKSGNITAADEVRGGNCRCVVTAWAVPLIASFGKR
jgi:hypothetical protein